MRQSFRMGPYKMHLKKILLLLLFSLLGACSINPASKQPLSDPAFRYERVVKDDVSSPLDIWDPFESVNRASYRFNARFDKYVYLPALSGYQYVTPDFIESGISNVFNNLDDIRTVVNQVLQLKVSETLQTSTRFITNTTLGVFGLFDVASYFGIPKHDEDFGQTLGFYGVNPGPYLVIPIMGPSNLRDGVGDITDSLIVSPLLLEDHPDRKRVVYPLRFLDERAKTSFRYYQTGSPFEYELVRLLYSTKRNIEVLK